jgi:acetyl esterase/lipase
LDSQTLKHLLTYVVLPLAALLGLAACSPVRTLNVIAERSSGYTFSGNIAYGDLPRQKLDIYTPDSAAPAGGWPVAVFFYGGSWSSGERDRYRFVGAALAARGVLTLVADYRLYPEVRYPDFLIDSAKAVAYAIDEARRLGGNPKRVFAMGHSAGGYNAAMLALDPRWLAVAGHKPADLAGWIGLAGPYDFFPTDDTDAQPVFFHPNYPPNAQPIEFISGNAPRAFLGSAVDDKVVNPTRSTQQLADKLSAAGSSVTLKFYKGASHQTLIGSFAGPLHWIAPVLKDVVEFIEQAPAVR